MAFLVAQDTGQATFIVRGYEIRTTVAAILGLILLLIGLTALAAWLLSWPRRIAQAAQRRKRESGVDALEAALLAAAGGDLHAARKEARRAQLLLERDAGPRLIAAQAAEQMGDLIGAEGQFAAMLGDARTALVGRRGLAAAALARRDFDTAILHAAQAFADSPNARWAFDLLFDAQVQAGRWEDAIETLAAGVKRKHLPDDAARRRRSVLLAAAAASIELTEPHRARDLAEQSASLSPAFAPGAALAARLMLMAGKGWRAAGLLEDSWTAAPHPAIALAYRDLKPEESERARAKRMIGLAEMNPLHRESRILLAEQALVDGDGQAATDALAPVLEAEPEPSARICGLVAQVAQARGHTTEAREWVARAAHAPGEPDWSDLDPEGPAFAYTPDDWARLVYSFGDTGKLIHPRHERFERQRLTAPTQLLLEAPETALTRDASARDPAARSAPAAAAAPASSDAAAPAPGTTRGPRPVPAFLAGARQPDDPGVDEG